MKKCDRRTEDRGHLPGDGGDLGEQTRHAVSSFRVLFLGTFGKTAIIRIKTKLRSDTRGTRRHVGEGGLPPIPLAPPQG